MKTTRALFVSVPLIIVLFISPSCNSGKDQQSTSYAPEATLAPTSPLTGTRWTLTELNGQPVLLGADMATDVHIELDTAGGVSGYTGCNRLHGSYKSAGGDKLSFSGMATTKMACPEYPVNESAYTGALHATRRFTIDGDTLRLADGHGTMAVFVKNPLRPEPITEKYWKLLKLNGQPVTMAKNQEREAYFTLKSDGHRVKGFAGCNTFTGQYSLETGNRIRFDKMATTMKACPDVDTVESAFLKIFELADNYTIHNDTLSLNIGRRAPLAVFEAVYFD